MEINKNAVYTKEVLDHFQNPRNMGAIENADIVGTEGNPSCGDVMKIFLKVEKNENGENYIKDIKFQTMGCAAAIATSSMVTELAKGKTIKEAKKITNQDVAKALGNLPKIKMHCSHLAEETLKKAIKDWEEKNK